MVPEWRRQPNFSCAAIIVDEDDAEKFLFQARDSLENIAFPGTLGLFGGASESGETPAECITRELYEELGFVVPDLKPIFKLRRFVSGAFKTRYYYKSSLACSSIKTVYEGSGFQWISLTNLTSMKIDNFVPLDLAMVLSDYFENTKKNLCFRKI